MHFLCAKEVRMALLDSNLPFSNELDAGTISPNTSTTHLLVTSA